MSDRKCLIFSAACACTTSRLDKTQIAAVRWVDDHGFYALGRIPLVCTQLFACSILNVLANTEAHAAKRLMDTGDFDMIGDMYDFDENMCFSQSTSDRLVRLASLIPKREMNAARIIDIYGIQDTLFRKPKIDRERNVSANRNHLAAVIIRNDGLYLGHVYVWFNDVRHLRMIGIRASLMAATGGEKSVSTCILRGIVQFGQAEGAETLSIDIEPIGAMRDVIAPRLGFTREKDWQVSLDSLASKLRSDTILPVFDMRCVLSTIDYFPDIVSMLPSYLLPWFRAYIRNVHSSSDPPTLFEIMRHLHVMRVRFRGATDFKTPKVDHYLAKMIDSRVLKASNGLYEHWFAENTALLEIF
jgi:hypothetical protein